MTTTYSVTIACDDRPGGGFACTASYTTRLTHPGESPSVALAAARLMGWTQTADPMGGYADRCPACSLLAGSKPAPPPIAPQGKCTQCPVPKPELGGGFAYQEGATWDCPVCGQDWIFTQTDQNSGTWWRMTVEGGGHKCQLWEPRSPGENWYCTECAAEWAWHRETMSWKRVIKVSPHPCRTPEDADRSKPWHCHCGQAWEYSQDVKAWTRMGHEE